MFKRLSILLILIIAVAACQPTPTAVPPTQPIPATVPPTEAPPTQVPPTAEPAVTPTPIHVDLTPAQLAAVQALADELNVTVDQIELVSTEAVTWPDHCLGVVTLGILCAQGEVEGFRIVLKAGDETYEYHTNQDGSVVALNKGLPAALRIAVRAADNSVQVVDTSVPLDPADTPWANGFLPAGGLAGNTLFVLTFNGPPQAVAVDPANPVYPPAVHPLDFIANVNYGLAVWPGDAAGGPLLAWATQPDQASGETTLAVAAPDGTLPQTLVTENGFEGAPYQLVAERWSADGQSLYFSREPYGIGGYIPFSGASSLYRVSLADQAVTELLPFTANGGPMICLDAMSRDERLVVDHCAAGLITVRDLASGQTTTLRPPADVSGYGLLGSARFSPDGSRVAFALAVGDPSAEQGWVAVSDGLEGESRLLAASQPGEFYSVVGWLNSTTLLVQSTAVSCGADCVSGLWTLDVTSSSLLRIADGTFLTVVDGYQP